MSSLILVAITALAPVVLVFSFVYFNDKLEREPIRLILLSFLLGAAATIPAGVFQYLTGVATSDISGYSTAGLLFSTIFLIAGSEEVSKFLLFRRFIYKRPNFNEPFDGIVYAVAVSLGFAALENFIYVLGFGLQIGLLRAVTAIPAHVTFGVFMGYFAGRAKFIYPDRSGRELRSGLLVAIFAHGLYDFCAFSPDPRVSYLSLLVLVICIRYSFKALKIQAVCALPSQTITNEKTN